jgi:hypothetical protein
LPCRVALSVCNGVPVALEPAYTFTVTRVESPFDVPAVPEKVGVAFVLEEPLAGWLSVTTGVELSAMVKVLVLLRPVFPAVSCCSARAVYCPFASGTLAGAVQSVPVRVTVRVWTGVPVALGPAYSLAVTVGESLKRFPALPLTLNSGLATVAPAVGWVTVTAGRAVSFTSMSSCGAFDDSRLASAAAGDPVPVRANVIVAFDFTSGVTSTDVQVPAVRAPEEAVIVPEGFGEPEYVTVVSCQPLPADRTANPAAELSVAKTRSVALLTVPPRFGTTNFT